MRIATEEIQKTDKRKKKRKGRLQAAKKKAAKAPGCKGAGYLAGSPAGRGRRPGAERKIEEKEEEDVVKEGVSLLGRKAAGK